MIFKRKKKDQPVKGQFADVCEWYDGRKLGSDGMCVLLFGQGAGEAMEIRTGDFQDQESYALADVTKLYTGAVVHILRSQGKIDLDVPIRGYLDEETMDLLHFFKRVDYSPVLTLRHLLSHSSGLADYFTEGTREMPAYRDLLPRDVLYSINDVLTRSKAGRPHFAPGTGYHYSDTNYQLIGDILERVLGMPLGDIYDTYLFRPLGFQNTYLYEEEQEYPLGNIYYKGKAYLFPKHISSARGAGGLISDLDEASRFLQAYFNGTLFPLSYLAEIQAAGRLTTEVRCGLGVLELSVGTALLYGYIGKTGSFSLYCPSKKIHLCGTTNEIGQDKMLSLVRRCFEIFQ